jgi:hypothetical protein
MAFWSSYVYLRIWSINSRYICVYLQFWVEILHIIIRYIFIYNYRMKLCPQVYNSDISENFSVEMEQNKMDTS